MPTRHQLSPHFTVEEFDSSDGQHVPYEAVFALKFLVHHVLEPMRSRFGPITITSGYRTKSTNAQAGGRPASRHLYKIHYNEPAMDLKCSLGTPAEWFAWLDEYAGGGIGAYTSHVHVDLRARKARW